MPSDEKPDSKPRAKRARPKRAKPAFAATPSDRVAAGWAYRSDAPASASQPAVTAPAAGPVAEAPAPLPAPAAPIAAHEAAPAPRAALPPHPAGSRLVASTLDALAVPIGIVLMASLAPLSALVGSRRKT